jgi:transcriptional regulator with XRE-family HTH domain
VTIDLSSGPTVTSSAAFHDWLRLELQARRMSQRQLAERSGVNHSTVSRIIRDQRWPSLSTAAKLARGLREPGGEADGTPALGGYPTTLPAPPTRVERALRSDDLLSDAQVRRVMAYYLALRSGRLGRTTPRAAARSTDLARVGAKTTLAAGSTAGAPS